MFREDIWKRSPTSVALRFPSQTKNLGLAKKVFEEGREKGLVDIHTIATVDDKVAATVWFPKFKEEEIQGWNSEMKLSIAKPLPSAEIVGQLRRFLVRLNPQFRHYQRFELWVGTKAWAAVQQPISAWSGLAMSGLLCKVSWAQALYGFSMKRRISSMYTLIMRERKEVIGSLSILKRLVLLRWLEKKALTCHVAP